MYWGLGAVAIALVGILIAFLLRSPEEPKLSEGKKEGAKPDEADGSSAEEAGEAEAEAEAGDDSDDDDSDSDDGGADGDDSDGEDGDEGEPEAAAPEPAPEAEATAEAPSADEGEAASEPAEAGESADAAPPVTRSGSQGIDEEPEGTLMADDPPAAGLGHDPLSSQEMSSSMEIPLLFDDEDDEATGPVRLVLVTASGRTDAGRRRKHNEDAIYLDDEEQLYIIADGMGGYAAGEVASQMAVETMAAAFAKREFVGDRPYGIARRGAELALAVQMANRAILETAAKNPDQKGMGTTVVCARFSPSRRRVYIAHVGDSRCYRLRGEDLEPMTIDHTLGAMGIKGPSAKKLSRAVGVFDDVEVDVAVDEPDVGDIYLLCSDGLSKMVQEERIAEIIRENEDIPQAVVALVDMANARGGKDNVSVILIRVEAADLQKNKDAVH